MNLTELQTEVYAITNRPDLADRTLSAIRAATLKIHQSDYFYKDLGETGIQFSTADYLQQIEFRTLVPRWRALSYIRKSDINQFDSGQLLEVVTPGNIVDSYNLNRPDVCYVAGSVIQIRSSTALQYAFLGCYINPDITLTGFDSWVALDHPFAIVYQAAATIFKSIGKDQEWQAWTMQAQEQINLVKISNIEAKGF